MERIPAPSPSPEPYDPFPGMLRTMAIIGGIVLAVQAVVERGCAYQPERTPPPAPVRSEDRFYDAPKPKTPGHPLAVVSADGERGILTMLSRQLNADEPTGKRRGELV